MYYIAKHSNTIFIARLIRINKNGSYYFWLSGFNLDGNRMYVNVPKNKLKEVIFETEKAAMDMYNKDLGQTIP